MVVTVLRRLDASPDPNLARMGRGGTAISSGHAVRGFPLWLRVLPLDYNLYIYSLRDRRGSPGKYLDRGRRYRNNTSESRKEVKCKSFNLCQFSTVPFRVLVRKRIGEPRPKVRYLLSAIMYYRTRNLLDRRTNQLTFSTNL